VAIFIVLFRRAVTHPSQNAPEREGMQGASSPAACLRRVNRGDCAHRTGADLRRMACWEMTRVRAFEDQVLPHLDAAYNLARWLLRDARAAEDAVQEASLRAWRYLDSLRDGQARAWLLGIVRNTCFDMLQQSRRAQHEVDFDSAGFEAALAAAPQSEPSQRLQQGQLRHQVDAAIRALSPPLREVLVLREMEDLDYAEIARIVGVPVGTVMSRLSRARGKLREALAASRMGE
jgi:RNA polymerase sigma-70 factor (ECF subfamily)